MNTFLTWALKSVLRAIVYAAIGVVAGPIVLLLLATPVVGELPSVSGMACLGAVCGAIFAVGHSIYLVRDQIGRAWDWLTEGSFK